MKTVIIAMVLVAAFASCNTTSTKNDSVADSLTVSKIDTSNGTKLDSLSLDSTETTVDSVNNVK